MSSPQRGERKKRGMGCWIVVMALIVLVGAAAFLVGQSVRKAKKTEQALNDTYGEAVAWVPAPDGSIPPERVEAFLRVREKVYEHCFEFQDRLGELTRLDSLENDDDLPKSTVARESFGGLKKLLGLGPAFLRFMETRNHALLEEEMGLGEYQYIYILAYVDQLRRVDETEYAMTEQAYVGQRARSELARILGNQLDALISGDVQPVDSSLTAGLRDQIAILETNTGAFPWEDGLPPAVAASLAPYAETIAQYYCAGIAKVELMQKNKGFNIKN